jgi:molybdenum cofactor cytidylyltransferase
VIWAVVLAAGESRRMGTQKLLLPYGDTTVAGAVVRTACDSRADRVLVVLGADREAVRAAIERKADDGRGASAAEGGAPDGVPTLAGSASKSVAFTINENYRSGMLSSIQAAFRALPADAEAAVVMLGDQPFLPVRAVDAIVGAYREGGRGIVVPVYGGRRGHPLIVDLKHRDEVLRLDPAVGLRQLLRAHPEDVREIEVDEAAILRDLDTPADYREQEGVRSTFYAKMRKK